LTLRVYLSGQPGMVAAALAVPGPGMKVTATTPHYIAVNAQSVPQEGTRVAPGASASRVPGRHLTAGRP
jgi:hypothetical protein